MSRIAISSDWHRDKRTGGLPRAPDVEMAVAQVVSQTIARECDLFLMLGDLADPDDGPELLYAAAFVVRVAMQLLEAGIPSWWVPGNHDVIEDGSGCSVFAILNALGQEDVRVFDDVDVLPLPGKSVGEPYQFLALPFTPVSHSYDPAARVREERKDHHLGERVIVGGHLMLEGITPGEESIEMPRGRDVRFPLEECDPKWLMFNGHYHEGQVYERAGRKVIIPGALARFAHGEERNRPRYLIVEV